MTISISLFFAVVLTVIAMLSPSAVAVIAILLTHRKASYLQTFLMINLWLVTVAVYFGALFVLPWNSADANGAAGMGTGVFFASVLNIIVLFVAGFKLAGANYTPTWARSDIGSTRKTIVR